MMEMEIKREDDVKNVRSQTRNVCIVINADIHGPDQPFEANGDEH